MSKITYKTRTDVAVYLDGEVVGHIRYAAPPKGEAGFVYCTGRGMMSRGKVYPTLAACKASLEAE